jgi:parallel beta-helix repeat protein
MGIGIRTEANATQIIGNIINGQIEAISTNESFTIITNNVLSGESGIDSYGSSNIDILNNQIVSVTSHGIDTHDTSFSSISDNSITGSEGVGISIEGNSNIIQNNAVFGLSDGMYIFSGDNNVLRTNDIANCSDIGIEGGQGLNNILTQNNVTRCQIGVEMGLEANNNTLYYNFFVNNLQEAKTQSNAFNNWDNGTTGNYWSDYQSRYPNATEIDSSGIGNTPYAIDPNNIDNYPLLHQTGISKLTSIAGISWLTIIIIVLALIGIIFFSLLLYRRHRKLYLKQ